MSLTRVTSKGQITIPQDVRKALGIKQSDYVVVVLDGDKAILSPVHSGKLADMKGKLPASRPYKETSEIRKEVGEDLGSRLEHTEP